MALETQERLKKNCLKYCTHSFYPCWSVLHSSLAIFQLHVNLDSLQRYILRLHFWIVFLIMRILLNQGPLYQGSVRYILL